MPEKTFLPYFYADEALEFSITEVKLDDTVVDTAGLVNYENCSINLSGDDSWSRAEISLTISDVNQQLASALTEKENPDSNIQILLATKASKSRSRSGIVLTSSAQNQWIGILNVRKIDVSTLARIQAIAVRAADTENTESGKASLRNERIGGSSIWTVYVDEKPPMPGAAIDNEWRNFATDPSSTLNERKDCVWYLDLSNDENPRLFLNEAINDLKRLMTSEAKHGRSAAARDALATSILQPVLITLATQVIGCQKYGSFDDLDGWQRKFLFSMAQNTSGDRSEEQTIDNWLNDWKANEPSKVLNDLQATVQRHLALASAAERLVNANEERPNG